MLTVMAEQRGVGEGRLRLDFRSFDEFRNELDVTVTKGDSDTTTFLQVHMLALRAWRSSLFAATRTPIAARYSITAEFDSPALNLMEDLSKPANDPYPPKPGAGGYDAPNPPAPNPMSQTQLAAFALQKPKYRLHCQSSRNNTIVAFTKPGGHVIAWFSGGSCGFKGGNRSGYEAGYQCAVRVFKKIEEVAKVAPIEIDVFFKGFGQGREALHKALLTSEGQSVRPLVATITDRTPIKIGGTRSKKRSRL
jgi:small subunit ribosomal protein S11